MLLASMVLTSCSYEKQLGNQFIAAQSQNSRVYLSPTGYIYKTNQKYYKSEASVKQSQAAIDSVKFANSNFLKYISDSVFLTAFTNGYLEELNALGLKVCLDGPVSPDCQLLTDNYTVKIDQLELREFLLKYTDEQFIVDAVYQKDIDLEAVSLHAWFLINGYNSPKPSIKPLYAENYVSDELLKGEFVKAEKTGKILHRSKKDKLTVEKIYKMATALGHKYASYTFDYLMNQYIFKNYPHNSKPDIYLHFDRFSGKLQRADEERFTRE